jgi:hypothetical protein
VVSAVETRLSNVLRDLPARPECIPAMTSEQATTESPAAAKVKPVPTPEQIDPGLAQGMDASPSRASIARRSVKTPALQNFARLAFVRSKSQCAEMPRDY